MSRARTLGFESIIKKLRKLGFEVRVEKYYEEEDDRKYVVREAVGRRKVYGYHVSAYVEEVNGKVEYVKFEVFEIPSIRVSAKNVEKAYQEVLKKLNQVVERKKRFSRIAEELRSLGFEVMEYASYMEAIYRKDALDYVRIVLRYEADEVDDGTMMVQVSLKSERVVDLAKKAVEIVK
ncbi:MAG: hypothetical protein DRJ47_10600 [Thermoprotei archaeon]|nr:MAG: hypothetical protein DRJ47_10600 [Thermoprotei archaeon]